ncbi:uncharacterized protein LOC115222074 [Argonauta hians]
MSFAETGLYFLCLSTVLVVVFGHGRLLEPPSRTSMWRMGYRTPPDYDDNGHNCGGVGLQFGRNKGKCGVCGDPYYGPHNSEAGGMFARGIITRTYRAGGIVKVLIQITANHKGYFEFHLCPNNNIHKKISHECLKKYPLEFLDGTNRYYLKDFRSNTNFSLSVKLPSQLTCSQCVLQWKYTAGNTYNCDPVLGKCCTGCGDQEQFYACSDIRIVGSHTHHTITTTTTAAVPQPPSPSYKHTTPHSEASKTTKKKTDPTGKKEIKCQAKDNLQPKKHFNKWCNLMCQPLALEP